MIAGLLQQQTKQNIDALPGMTNLPILGSLFRSRDYLNGETELVIIITPYIVDPTKPQNLQTPADGLQIAERHEHGPAGPAQQGGQGAGRAPTAGAPIKAPSAM
jgi:Flp pilus assembly secretin CpaC